MDSQLSEQPISNAMPNPTDIENSEAPTPVANEPTWFQTYFIGCMEMYADASTVAKYFDAHHVWFRRCAHPMKAEPVGENGYALTIGRFGAQGYRVEPKIGLHLLPQDRGVYRIETIAVPDYTPPGYEVEFKAEQKLVEVPTDPSVVSLGDAEDIPPVMTRVEWDLDLRVGVKFPRFIHKLPETAIKNTGDRVLAQIVKQVSRRLTYKVQEDFHSTRGVAALTLFKKKWALTKGRGVCEERIIPQKVNGESWQHTNSEQDAAGK